MLVTARGVAAPAGRHGKFCEARACGAAAVAAGRRLRRRRPAGDPADQSAENLERTEPGMASSE